MDDIQCACNCWVISAGCKRRYVERSVTWTFQLPAKSVLHRIYCQKKGTVSSCLTQLSMVENIALK
jgi:hypothetical protein